MWEGLLVFFNFFLPTYTGWTHISIYLNRSPTSAIALRVMLYIGPISASPTACLLRGYGRAGTQNDRLVEGFPNRDAADARMHVFASRGKTVILSTCTSIPAQ